MPSVFSTPTTNELPWLIRADFTDPAGWQQICRAVGIGRDEGPGRHDGPGQDEVGEPGGQDDALVDFEVLDDAGYAGLTPERLLALEPHPGGQYFLVDRLTLSHPEHPVLTVDVGTGRSFRLIPRCVPEFAVNILLGSMDVDDFADSAHADGIFRGFGPTVPPVNATDPVGLLQDVVAEADPDDPHSFIGELIRTGFWNPASWQRLEAGMREACRVYDGAAEVPRALTAAFHSVQTRLPNLVVLPGFVPMDPGGVEDRLHRIGILSAWFFRGWSTDRPRGPLPGEYDPRVAHG